MQAPVETGSEEFCSPSVSEKAVGSTASRPLIVFAPGVSAGGGLVLLLELLRALPNERGHVLYLDERIKGHYKPPLYATVHWVQPRAVSRLWAEWHLYKQCDSKAVVLCFHGLPPILQLRGQVTVFVQNRLVLGRESPPGSPVRAKLRLAVLRELFWRCRTHSDNYFVQSESMLYAFGCMLATRRATHLPTIQILPFSRRLPFFTEERSGDTDIGLASRFEFIYPASGEAHKNHGTLLRAWELLAAEGIKPALILTVESRFTDVQREIESATGAGANVINVGWQPHDDLLRLVRKCRAVVYPSLFESYGLPLLEAVNIGIPIVASELDYVRDVCTPVESFDPHSPVSVCRAVKRALGLGEKRNGPVTAEQFIRKVLTVAEADARALPAGDRFDGFASCLKSGVNGHE